MPLVNKNFIIMIILLFITFDALPISATEEIEITLFDIFRHKLGYNLCACMLGALLGSIANICLRIQKGNLQIKEHPFTTILINIFLNMFIAFLIFLFLNSELHLRIFSSPFDPMSQFIIVILTAFLGDNINDHLFAFIKEKFLDKIGDNKDSNHEDKD